jgi:acyl-CoA thioester hydrolase
MASLVLRVSAPPPLLAETARYRVLFGDCDPMRIVYYANYLRVFEIGRAELFRALGHPFADYVAQGRYLAVIEAACRYHAPARYDDELRIHTGVTHLGRARLTIHYDVRGPAGAQLVTGHTMHAVLDDAGRPQRLPDAVRDALARTLVALPPRSALSSVKP